MWKPIAVCAVLFAVAGTPQSAAAITINMPNQANSFAVLATVTTAIGPVARLLISYDGGVTCPNFPFVAVGSSLTETTTINGTSFNDIIFVITAPTTFCGYSIGVVNHNNRILNLNGQGGNDIINGGLAGFNVDGQGEHDWLACNRSNCQVNGDVGDDILQATPSNATIDGDAGSDRGCAMNAARLVGTMIGGDPPGTDNRCGSAGLLSGWEASGNCSAPCNL